MTSLMRNYFTLSANQRPTVGDTKMSVTNADHTGWLKCNGRGLSTSEFNILFQVIGYSFGGSGTTFNLPQAAGHVLGMTNNPAAGDISINDASGVPLSTRLLGSNVGEERHTLTKAEMPTHNHGGLTDLSGTGITTNATGPSGSGYGLVYQNGTNTMNAAVNDSINEINLYATSVALTINDPTHRHGIQNDGGSNAHNNMQPTLFIGNMFIYSGKPTYNNPSFYSMSSYPTYNVLSNVF